MEMGRRNGIITILLLVISQCILAQAKHFSKEVIVITDNDNYLVQKRDGYYTNGFYFAFQKLSAHHKPNEKAIMRYELGQMIFNPYKYSITHPENMDRPFAGYLFIKASRSRFFQSGANLQYGVSVGTIGKSSGAQQTQRTYHDLINIYPVEGWGYQVHDEFGINFSGQYSHPLVQIHGIDVHGLAKANIGNTFTNGIAGMLFRIGLFENADQSVAWNSRLHKEDPHYLHRREFFVFYQPEAMLQIYNATLQGGMFRKDKGPVLDDIQPWIYQHRVGIMYASRRMSIVLGIIHRTKEAPQMRRSENYGSIQLSYRFN